MAIGRNGHAPIWLWADLVMGRNDPEPRSEAYWRLTMQPGSRLIWICLDFFPNAKKIPMSHNHRDKPNKLQNPENERYLKSIRFFILIEFKF